VSKSSDGANQPQNKELMK